MSDLATQLIAEKLKRITVILNKLVKIGQPELADELRAILTLDETIAILTQTAPRVRASKANTRESNETPAPDGFSLGDEVRLAIRKIRSPRFRSLAVYELMHRKFPMYITPDKKPRIGATLSNMVTAGELTVDKDGQRKVWYRVANLRDVPQSDLDFITETFSETVMN